MRKTLAMAAVLLGSSLLSAISRGASNCPPASAVPYLHSHNDYLRDHPLFDALRFNFDSVEADVWFIDGELRVGHDRGSTRPHLTLESEYLVPMFGLFRKNHGWVRSDHKNLGLLIECKSEPVSCYGALRQVLPRFKAMLTVYEAGKTKPGAVTAILTGHHHMDVRMAVASEMTRYIALDGHLSDLNSTAPADLIPWVSASWSDMASYSNLDMSRAAQAACAARRQGRKLRIYDGPDETHEWGMECAAGVDILSTDHLTGMRNFLPYCRRPSR